MSMTAFARKPRPPFSLAGGGDEPRHDLVEPGDAAARSPALWSCAPPLRSTSVHIESARLPRHPKADAPMRAHAAVTYGRTSLKVGCAVAALGDVIWGCAPLVCVADGRKLLATGGSPVR